MRGRAGRLRAWCKEHERLILEGTSLLKELVRLIGEFVVPLDHVWSPIPARLYLVKCQLCETPNTAASEFRSCVCWSALYQHTCSIYTIGESAATHWRVSFSPRTTQWWIGIVWSSSQDGFQLEDYSDDSMRHLENVFGAFICHDGTPCRIDMNSDGVGVDVRPCPPLEARLLSKVCSVDIQVSEDSVRFSSPSFKESIAIHFKSFRGGSCDIRNARPFAQLRRQDSRSIDDTPFPRDVATIQTID